MKDNSQETPKSLSKRSHSISKYAAQCGKCFKWRLFDTQEEFEDIRSKFIEEPFYCDRKLDVSCEDPADIEYDASRTWVIDKPNIPKTPEGKKCRTRNEIAQFIKENPEYEDVSLSDFDFSTPKVMEDTIPEHVVRKASANGSSNKRLKSTKG
ncbi:methyl-CpG-binding domain-containing protein 4-like isoform X2 [Juglans microcarpa x Juglans regia]|uniref:methyl-CpG-binding domain-containing protein 4-like isoform X2 n=1 Tax=Juglans microcarpa x Juglans regia TaxID=2249226 RepID=UPI001B7DAF81|nr:methyl-CpG-binding domain-containing protein 4-like isoform X2 [Juglans microcarpa x Juglans regia]